MDVFTHFLLPYAAVALLRRPRSERLAAGIGGYAPDLDVLWFPWMNHAAPGAYAFAHRGWSHTVWGGALLAVLLLAVLTHPSVRRRSRSLEAIGRSRAAFAIAAAASLTHTLLLDVVTITGTPAFWPFSEARVALDFFFFAVTTATLASLVTLVLAFRGRVGERGLAVGAVAVVALVAVSGAVRLATRPAEEPGSVVWPTPLDGRWIAMRPDGENAWKVRLEGFGEPRAERRYGGNATAEAAAAVEACRGTGAYLAERWSGSGAEVVDALGTDRGVRVWITDVGWRYVEEAQAWDFPGWRPPWTRDEPFDPDEDAVRCDVEGGRVVAVLRPVGFWG